MTVITINSRSSFEEVCAEMDRRGAVIEKLEASLEASEAKAARLRDVLRLVNQYLAGQDPGTCSGGHYNRDLRTALVDVMQPPAGEKIRATQDGSMEPAPITGQSTVGAGSPSDEVMKDARALVAKRVSPHARWFYLSGRGDAHAAVQACAEALSRAERAEAAAVRCSVMEMQSTAGSDFYVSIERDGKQLTPHSFKEHWKAAYEVAEWNWLLNGAPKPDLAAWEEHPNPVAAALPPAPDAALEEGRRP